MRIPRYVMGMGFVVAVAALFVYLHMTGLLPTFAMVQEERMKIEEFIMRDPMLGIAIFSLLYISAAALSIPIATPLTILSGFLFGTVLGSIIVIISATIGATLIFILARFFFRNFFTRKFGDRVEAVNQEFTDHGLLDVILLRLIPAIPFVIINVATALTSVSLRNYVLGTMVGIVPLVIVYVHAGTGLARIQSVSDILSFETIFSISAVVGVTALLIFIRRRRTGRRSLER